MIVVVAGGLLSAFLAKMVSVEARGVPLYSRSFTFGVLVLAFCSP